VIHSYNRNQHSQFYFDIQLYMFRTDLLSIIRSLYTVLKLLYNIGFYSELDRLIKHKNIITLKLKD